MEHQDDAPACFCAGRHQFHGDTFGNYDVCALAAHLFAIRGFEARFPRFSVARGRVNLR